MPTPIYRVVYVSAASELFSKSALLELLSKAREKNNRLGVTGMLLYKDGDFIQLLEGERTVVQALYQTILRDPRHHGATMLLDGEADARMFSDWSMGFRDLSDPAVQATPGFSQFMNSRLVAERFADDPTGCLGLLALFKPKF